MSDKQAGIIRTLKEELDHPSEWGLLEWFAIGYGLSGFIAGMVTFILYVLGGGANL